MFENNFPRHVSDVTDILTQSLFQLSTSTNLAVAIFFAKIRRYNGCHSLTFGHTKPLKSCNSYLIYFFLSTIKLLIIETSGQQTNLITHNKPYCARAILIKCWQHMLRENSMNIL